MAEQTLQLELPLLLPEVEDERDPCVERLRARVAARAGIRQAHLDQGEARAVLCLHFNPDLLTLDQVERLATRAGAQVSQRYRHENLWVTGMDCGDCALSIEHILRRLPGILNVSASYAAERLRVEYDTTEIRRKAIVERVEWMGYGVRDVGRRRGWTRKHRQLVMSAAAGLALAAGVVSEALLGLPRLYAVGFYALAYLAGGYDITRHALKAAQELRFDIDFLMVVAAAGAAVLGRWPEGAFLLTLFSLGHALERYAMDRARGAIRELGEVAPRRARVRREGREQDLPVEELLRGDTVVVRPGERVPVDGEVLSGRSDVDQSPVTGESVPVEVGPGDPLFAGSLNGAAGLEVRVTKLAQDSTLARVIQLVEQAQTQKSPSQRLSDRFSRVFVRVVLVSVVVVAVLPPLAGWLAWRESAVRALTLLVAASPCALAIATPSAILSGIARGARRGVLIKGGAQLESLGRVRALALDKTGTLTHGRPEVTDVVVAEGATRRDLLRIAAGLESRSTHPLAKAVHALAAAEGIEIPQPERLESARGGLIGTLDGESVRVGSRALFEGALPQDIEAHVRRLEASGKTAVTVQQGSRVLGVLALADRPRVGARQTLARLRALGVGELVMLTGDHEAVAKAIAGEVGLTDYRAGLLPEEKVHALERLRARYGTVAMVGDGVNDAPALAAATVGIAMGAGGSDVALETADVALMADDLAMLPFAVGLSRAAYAIMRQNLALALGVIAMLAPLAVLGVAGIGPAIVLHEGSTLLVVANALRLLGYESEPLGGAGAVQTLEADG